MTVTLLAADGALLGLAETTPPTETHPKLIRVRLPDGSWRLFLPCRPNAGADVYQENSPVEAKMKGSVG